MVGKLMKLELIYAFVGKRLMVRCIFFAIVVALMPVIYIVREAGPCDLKGDSKPLFSRRGIGFESLARAKISSIRARKQRGEFYTAIFRDQIRQGLLRPGFKGLCLGADAGQSLLALQENSLVGIDQRSCAGHLPFADNAFDFVFTRSLDRAPAPAALAIEIERTLRPSGVAIVLVSLRKDPNPIHFLSPVVALFRNSDVVHVTRGENSSVVTLRKRDSISKPLKQCTSQKQNRSLIELAEPLTKSHSHAIYLPNVVDISTRKRHVYLEIAPNDTESIVSGRFLRAYPKKDKGFMMYVVVVDESSPACCANLSGVETVVVKQGSRQGLGVGEWMRKNVGEEDFVVVKVGFEYVRGMIQSGGMCLIDEIFVLCNPDDSADCLQLLHTLRNNGVFAHKW